MARQEEGLPERSAAGSATTAVHGSSERLETCSRATAPSPSTKPNLSLAAAFGVEVALLGGPVERLLTKLGASEANADTAEAFLPIAAAHGWTAMLREGKLKHPAPGLERPLRFVRGRAGPGAARYARCAGDPGTARGALPSNW